MLSALYERGKYFLRSTRGLTLMNLGLVALVVVVWGSLSGPMAEVGVKEVVVELLGMRLVPGEREGRIVMLYHVIGVSVVAFVTYLITHSLPMPRRERTRINASVTVGYLTVMFNGLGFAYFTRSWIFHGLFLFGMAVMFYGGLLLAAALWPWRGEYRVDGDEHAGTSGGVDLERVAFFSTVVATLGSAVFGAVAGSYWGNGFETFLAEDVIRVPHHTVLEYAVIGHLHIMLALIGVATMLLIGRWFDFKGPLQKWAMPLVIVGTIVMTLGVWGVVTPLQPIAHTVIYVGATPAMVGALFLVIFGFNRLIGRRLKELGITEAGFYDKVKALLHDPLKFGALWQMIFMNFTVSGVGIFMAVTLEEIFRVWSSREERIALTGHWHILATLIGTVLLLRYADMMGLKGRLRRYFGWTVIIGSDLAFGAVTVFSLKRLFVDPYYQQPVVDMTMNLTDVGLGLTLLALGIFLAWRLFDIFKADGRWRQENQPTDGPGKAQDAGSVPGQGRRTNR